MNARPDDKKDEAEDKEKREDQSTFIDKCDKQFMT